MHLADNCCKRFAAELLTCFILICFSACTNHASITASDDTLPAETVSQKADEQTAPKTGVKSTTQITETESRSVKTTEAETESRSVKTTEAETENRSAETTEAETESRSAETTEAETESRSVKTTEAETESRSAEITEAETETETEEQTEVKTLTMKIGSTAVTVDWEENDAVSALAELVKDNPLTIEMSMYGGFEQVGSLGTDLPIADGQLTTRAGDVVLYSGNRIVIFYGSNSWAYTRLGHITDKSASEMTELLGNGNVTVTIS